MQTLVTKTKQEEIKARLCEIERIEGVRILYACESGSRAWGFPSVDSDYDVRFIYAHPAEWYVTLESRRDVIERPLEGDLDISGSGTNWGKAPASRSSMSFSNGNLPGWSRASGSCPRRRFQTPAGSTPSSAPSSGIRM
jgi:hypothetical protein